MGAAAGAAPAVPAWQLGALGGVPGGAGPPQDLGPLVDGAWTRAAWLVQGAWSRGMNVEVPTLGTDGAINGTAVFEVEEVGTPGPTGIYLGAQFRGASVAAVALQFDGFFPGRGAGPRGLLHLCSGGVAACAEAPLGGWGVVHLE